MNKKVANWIVEYFLRQPICEKNLKEVISYLPLNDDDRTKKTLLLRSIELEVSNGVVSEKVLEFLEIIEELDHRAGKKASNLMEEAYCAVAVDWTVRLLGKNGKCLETFKRVRKKGRVSKTGGLISEELIRWLGDIEAAVHNSEVCEKIWMKNTKNMALKAVKSYVKEAWECMGPPFLESMATKVGIDGGDGGGTVVNSEFPCRNVVASEGVQNSQDSLRPKHVAVKTRHTKGAKIPDADEDAEVSMRAAIDDPTNIMDKVQETHQSDSMLFCAGVNVSHLDASQAAHNVSITKAKDSTSNTDAATNMTVPVGATPEVQAYDSSPGELDAAVSNPRADALNLPVTKANESTSNVDAAKNKTVPVIHATFEVNRVQEALKSSTRELHKAVIDPLPEVDNLSFIKAKDCTSNMDAAKKKTVPVIHAAPEVTRVQEAPMPSSREVRAAVINPLPKALKVAATLQREGVTGNDETAVGNQTGAEIHAFHGVDGMQQASEPRSMKLHAAVHNPSPDVSQPAKNAFLFFEEEWNLPSKMAAKDMSNDPAFRTPVPRESTDKNVENGDKKDEHNGNNQGNGTHEPKEQHKRKRSLMDGNKTSQTLDWDESIDNLSCDVPVGPRLGPSPNRRIASSCYGGKKIRRERKNWTPKEEDVLSDAVRRFGHRWSLILEKYDIFRGRTDVDLKDKWRNMSRSRA